MHRIPVDLIPREECRRRVLGTDYPIEVDDTVVCTKAQKESNNLCQVDVGGPLACDQGDGIYTLMGVYSQDTGCVPTNQVISTFHCCFFIVINCFLFVFRLPPSRSLTVNG